MSFQHTQNNSKSNILKSIKIVELPRPRKREIIDQVYIDSSDMKSSKSSKSKQTKSKSTEKKETKEKKDKFVKTKQIDIVQLKQQSKSNEAHQQAVMIWLLIHHNYEFLIQKLDKSAKKTTQTHPIVQIIDNSSNQVIDFLQIVEEECLEIKKKLNDILIEIK